MIKFSDAQEELEIMRRAVLHEVNEGLDDINEIAWDEICSSDRKLLSNVLDNLREILRIMSR